MSDVQQHARNAMIGLAIGDAMSWTAMFHRSILLPPWTRRKRREMDTASETTNVIVTPMPFTLNQPADHLSLSPTVPTEWAAFTAGTLLASGVSSYKESVLREWMNLALSKDPIRGGVSTQAALHNLNHGILPPQCGKENPHYFDDGAMSRSVPIGILCSGRPDEAARLAEIDASVTNSEDGIWAAQAMAVAISLACDGKTMKEAIERARQYLPESSWIKRTVDEALSIAGQSRSIFSLVPDLHKRIVNREYSYGNAAPETLALTLSIAQSHGESFETALLTATGFAKSAETLPALVGALVGARQNMSIASESWLKAIGVLKGICVPSLAGKDYLALTEEISTLAGQKIL